MDWDVSFVCRHISVIRGLLEHLRADSGTEWFPAISPVITHSLDSIQAILRNLDLQAAGRRLYPERFRYWRTLQHVEAISTNRCGGRFITPSFVACLTDTFSGLIGEEDWRNTGSHERFVQFCKHILIRLEAKIESRPTRPARSGTPQTSEASDVGSPHPDEVRVITFTFWTALIVRQESLSVNNDENKSEYRAQREETNKLLHLSPRDPPGEEYRDAIPRVLGMAEST